MSNSSTRRMYRRIDHDCHACILTSSTIRRCWVRDFSLSGFRITRPDEQALSANTSVMIRVWLPGVPAPIDIDHAMVRWERDGEIGVEILSISPGADFQLAECIERVLRKTMTHEGASRPVPGERLSGDDVGIQARVRGLRQRAEA